MLTEPALGVLLHAQGIRRPFLVRRPRGEVESTIMISPNIKLMEPAPLKTAPALWRLLYLIEI